jgi:hypothetical protein
MQRASKIYITWPFNIQIAEINLNQNTTKRIFHPVFLVFYPISTTFREKKIIKKLLFESKKNKKELTSPLATFKPILYRLKKDYLSIFCCVVGKVAP